MANRKTPTRSSPRNKSKFNANTPSAAGGSSVAPEPSRPAEFDSACNNPENGSQSNPQLGIDRRQTTIPSLEGNIDIHANSNTANSQLVPGPFGRTNYSHPQLPQTSGLAAASAQLQLAGMTSSSSEVAVWNQQFTPIVRPSGIELVNTPSATRPQQLALEGPQAMDTQSDSDVDIEAEDSPSSQDSPSSTLADIMRGIKLNTPPREERRAPPAVTAPPADTAPPAVTASSADTAPPAVTASSALAAFSSRRAPVTAPRMGDAHVSQTIIKESHMQCTLEELINEGVRRRVLKMCRIPGCHSLAHVEDLCRPHYNKARSLNNLPSLSIQKRINEREARKHALRKFGHLLKHTVMVGQRYRYEGRVFIVDDVIGDMARLEDMETFEPVEVLTSRLNASMLVTSD